MHTITKVYTSKKKRTVSIWKSGLIFLTVWISFHSFATKYVLHMLTGTVALRTPPSPGQRDKIRKSVSSLFWKSSKTILVQWLFQLPSTALRTFPLGRSQSIKNMSMVIWDISLCKNCRAWKWQAKHLKVSTLSLLMKTVMIFLRNKYTVITRTYNFHKWQIKL